MSQERGKLIGVYLGSRQGEAKIEARKAELIPGHGLRGDYHAGRDPERQVSLFSSEVLEELRSEGFSVTAGEISSNLLTSGIRLDSLRPGARLRIGGALIEIVEPRKPCRSITGIDNRLSKRLYGRCGQLGRILEGGFVETGDEIMTTTDDRQPGLLRGPGHSITGL